MADYLRCSKGNGRKEGHSLGHSLERKFPGLGPGSEDEGKQAHRPELGSVLSQWRLFG